MKSFAFRLGFGIIVHHVQALVVPDQPNVTTTALTPSLEPRADGSADVAAYRQAAAIDLTRYAQRAAWDSQRPGFNASDVNLVSNAARPRKRGMKEARSSPAIQVPLVAAPLDLYPDAEYLCKTGVPSNTFMARLDTLGVDYVVPSIQCVQQRGCVGADENKYDDRNRLWTRRVLVGGSPVLMSGAERVAWAETYFDDVSIGGITAKGMELFSAVLVYGLPAHDGITQAIMGMQPHSSTRSWLGTIYKQGQFGDRPKEFALYFGRIPIGTGSQSQLTIGGRNPSLFTGMISEIPLVPHPRGGYLYWAVIVDSMSVNSAVVRSSRVSQRNAWFDSATTLIFMDYDAASSIFQRVPGAMPVIDSPEVTVSDNPSRAWVVPCNGIPTIEIVLGGRPFAVDPMDLNLGRLRADGNGFTQESDQRPISHAESYCLTAIRSATRVDRPWYARFKPPKARAKGYVYLGTAFLKSWVSIYSIDPPTVSLAQAVVPDNRIAPQQGFTPDLPESPPKNDFFWSNVLRTDAYERTLVITGNAMDYGWLPGQTQNTETIITA